MLANGLEANQLNGQIDDDISEEEIMNMIFESVEKAESFYHLYSRCVGFGYRRADRKVDKAGVTRYRKWVCHREGSRDKKWLELADRVREHRAITRVECRACFRIKYDPSSGKYLVREFVKEHSHPLASQGHVQFLRAHRKVTEADVAQARTMQGVGIKTSQIMKLFVLQSGGYNNVRFTPKDLYNRLDAERREETKDGDAYSAIAYLSAKKDMDPMFFFKYDVDKTNKLQRLLWADSVSRVDFEQFGDVLAFDTTYRTNVYRKPLVVMAGINNHFKTCIFACALLSDEVVETYEWVLTTFMEAMNGEKPCSILTDGDRAMRQAICKVIPSARHRLCSWHLCRNVVSHVQSKNFAHGFSRCMSQKTSVEQFEVDWERLVRDCGLESHDWVSNLHSNRSRWAESYLRGHFFGGMRATQRCEKMNAFLKSYLYDKMRLYEFVRAFELAIAWLRNSNAEDGAKTENTSIVPTTQFVAIEKHAAEVYTRNIFMMVRKQLKRQGLYFKVDVVSMPERTKYYLGKYDCPERVWIVEVNNESMQMECTCMKLESKGVPCCHIFRVMVLQNMKQIPEPCIYRRWTRLVCGRSENRNLEIGLFVAVTQMARYGMLSTLCGPMCYYASHVESGTRYLTDAIQKETEHMKKLWLSEKGSCSIDPVLDIKSLTNARDELNVFDPDITVAKGDKAITKGKKKKAAKCGVCG